MDAAPPPIGVRLGRVGHVLVPFFGYCFDFVSALGTIESLRHCSCKARIITVGGGLLT